jgi:hypothetical protein
MARKISKIASSTTPGHRMFVRSWLAELIMRRSFAGRLPPYFWRETKWKWRYTNEVKAISKFIKKFGEDMVLKIVCENKKLKTAASYGELEYLLQEEEAKLKRLALPKDTSPVINEAPASHVDLREPRVVSKKKGLFERLNDFEEL